MSEREFDRADEEPGTPSTDADVFGRVLREYDFYHNLHLQDMRRRHLLRQLGESCGERKSAYVAFCCSEQFGAAIDADDIAPLTDVLLSTGQVEQLNLIISGPGGDGTIAEKIVEICRSFCDEFRVVVPNRAKSAATLIALAADEIVMGFCSELGPIDAQVPVVVGDVPHLISAQSFIDARQRLLDEFYEVSNAGKDARGVLQQLALLEPAFVDHCEKLMAFSRDVGRKFLRKYMFRDVTPKRRQRQVIDRILKALSSVEHYKVHGRLINGHDAKHDLQLRVRLLGKDDETWKRLWQYYVRVEALLGRLRVAKLIESAQRSLFSRALGVKE